MLHLGQSGPRSNSNKMTPPDPQNCSLTIHMLLSDMYWTPLLYFILFIYFLGGDLTHICVRALYICVCVHYIYIYIYIYVCVCVCIYVYKCSLYLYVHVCVCIIYMCVCVWIIYMYIYECVCVLYLYLCEWFRVSLGAPFIRPCVTSE